jgi:hypothetical protein
VTPFEREVRAQIYEAFFDGLRQVDASMLAGRSGWVEEEIRFALRRLADEHRIALTRDGSVWMAHPFSGVPTSYRSVRGDRWWYANCAWDALGILALLGDGEVHKENGLLWRVGDGLVSPNGYVHLLVPARNFWDDIGFT